MGFLRTLLILGGAWILYNLLLAHWGGKRAIKGDSPAQGGRLLPCQGCGDLIPDRGAEDPSPRLCSNCQAKT